MTQKEFDLTIKILMCITYAGLIFICCIPFIMGILFK